MTEPPVDDRAPFARAIEQAAHVTTIAFMMVLPALPGYWLDRYLNTIPLFTVLGLALGMTAAIWQLIKLVNRPDDSSPKFPSGSSQAEEESSREAGDAGATGESGNSGGAANRGGREADSTES